jgi:DNA polymerase-3 subunit alpha
MLQVGTFVYITGHVVERYKKAGIWELRPRKLSLLSEIREKMSKSLQLHLPVQQVNVDLANRLEQILAEYPGKCPLMLHLTDSEEAMQVVGLSRGYKVKPSNAFFEAVQSIPGATCRLLA